LSSEDTARGAAYGEIGRARAFRRIAAKACCKEQVRRSKTISTRTDKMHEKTMTRMGALAVAAAIVAGCATQQGTNTAAGAGVGGVAGALIGDLVGGKQGAEIGALSGAATGATAGHFWQDISSSLFGSDSASNPGVQASQQTDGSLRLNLPSDLSFSKGSAALKPSAGAFLDKIGQQLMQNPGITAQVNGYTDNTGSRALNQTLSQKRASAVAKYLAGYLNGHGVSPAGRISAQGFGEDKSIASNDTDFGRKENRRVEIILHAPQQSAQQAQQQGSR
jgi:outer membrane protein OmpA-like peptidoglycan-associated protein